MKGADIKEKKIRLGIIGIGNMGSGHACRVVDGECPDFVLTAVADINPARKEWAEKRLGKDAAFFSTAEAMLDSGLILRGEPLVADETPLTFYTRERY